MATVIGSNKEEHDRKFMEQRGQVAPVGRIPKNYTESKKLAEMLERAGNKAGYEITREGSKISPSQYVTFQKLDDDFNIIDSRQVRLSNHEDKYPNLSPIGADTLNTRFSVDPSSSSHGTYEQSVLWLEKMGFPTSLSSKYKNFKYEAKPLSAKDRGLIFDDRLGWIKDKKTKPSKPVTAVSNKLSDLA